MKRLLIILISLTAAVATFAQSGLGASQRAVGIVKGDSIQTRDVAIGAEGTYPVAAALTAEQLRPYIGCDVVGIRFALSMDMTKTTVFINAFDSSKGMIGEEKVSQSSRYPVEGWNNVFFTASKKYHITGEEGLLFGIEYTETAGMVAAEQGALCVTGANNSGYGFFISGNFGSGPGWYSSSTGNLCVQLIVDVSSLPASDVNFTTLTTGFKYKRQGEQIDFFTMFSNAGRNMLDEVTLSAWFDDEKAATYSVSAGREDDVSYEHLIAIPADMKIGQHRFTLKAESVNGTPLAEERSISENFVLYDTSFSRQQHYVEQYKDQTTLVNVATDKIMNEVAENPRACLVNVYDESSALHVDGTDNYVSRYAYTMPCFTVDRSYYPGEAYVAYDVNDYATVVPEIMVSVIDEIVYEQDSYPAFATIDIQPQFDAASRFLDITVKGDFVEDAAALLGDAALTVMLVQDNVISPQRKQSITGKVMTDNGYVHQHVLRSYVTAPCGDRLSTDGTGYEMHFTTVVPDAWNADDISIVAIISKAETEPVTTQNLPDYDVNQCNSVRLADNANGIVEVRREAPVHSGYTYNLHGQRVNAAAKGIVIRDGRKFRCGK